MKTDPVPSKDDLLPSKEKFLEETLDKVHERYSGFGRDLYPLIGEKLPHVFCNLRFYQDNRYQMEDSYAVYEDPGNPAKSFAIQLDPHIEVIVLWNSEIQTEIGSWAKNPEEKAIIFILDELLGFLE